MTGELLDKLLEQLIWFIRYTAQKFKFSIKDFFSNCEQIRRKLRIWLHLLEKSLMENFIFLLVLRVFNKVVTVKKNPDVVGGSSLKKYKSAH